MWSDRKQNESPAVPVERPSVAVIGQGMVIKGDIRSGESMHIAGEINGSLDLAGYDLTITAESRVHANVTAREVDISGSIEGNVDATRKITVRNGGRLIGDLRTPGIVIEDGAYFKGSIEIVTREQPRDGEDASAAPTQTTAAHA
jgi:cytoskeletal protein CcmA (bactofilin family)